MTTKEKILKSALKLFTKYGINKTSTAKISKDVGIAEGTLFVHFKTKQDLIDSLYIAVKKSGFGDLGDLIVKNDTTEVNVKRLSKHLIEHFVSNPKEFIFIGLVESDPQISPKALRTVKESYMDVTKAVVEWQKKGDLKNVDIELLGGTLWGVIEAIVRHLTAKKESKVKDSHLNLVWEAVKK